MLRRRLAPALAALAFLGLVSSARADVTPQRTFYKLVSSNGHGAILLDLQAARLTHFHEHLVASEEPQLTSSGSEILNAQGQPLSVITRDLLYDTYFGLRASGGQAWLTSSPVDLGRSGYAPWQTGKTGGTGVATMVQTSGSLETTQYYFAPAALGHDGFVMAMRVKNVGAAPITGISAFSIHNFHLGYGRYGAIADLETQDIAANGETIDFDGASGRADFLERAFAGVVVARPLGAVAHHGTSNPTSAIKVYDVVANGGTTDLPDLNGPGVTADDSVSAYQWNIGSLMPGAEAWVGVAFAHSGDPFAGPTKVQPWLDAYVGTKGAQQLVSDEIASWAALQSSIAIPAGTSADEETLLRQSAVTLTMAQVQEQTTYLREHFSNDTDARYTRFGTTAGGAPATLPADVVHDGKGAMLACLPPGEWQVAWIRDGSYAAAALAELGLKDQAKAALQFYLGAQGGRFQSWNELQPYSMPPYQISLCRYYGFGVEETDFNDFGPNLEFDGFGLFLWSLRHYEKATSDTSLVDASWPTVSTKIADVLVALIDPSTGLLRPDSSIWETHFKGRQRTWTYTNLTAARGLCDASALAARVGDTTRAKTYHDAGVALRAAIATKLTDASGALASNAEELAVGEGYWDAAVLDAIAMGLFDPNGRIAKATLAGLDAHLSVSAGAGWSRNDDRTDHAGSTDVSPWGSEYDSAEWIVTDLRGAVAKRLAGDTARADRLLAWVRDQSLTNYLAVSETYDETTGLYKFNAPMVGFGAGVWALALANRAQPLDEPACGAYYDEGTGDAGPSDAGDAGDATSSDAGDDASAGDATPDATIDSSLGDAGSDAPNADASSGDVAGDGGGCGCRTAPQSGASGAIASMLAALAIAARRRRR